MFPIDATTRKQLKELAGQLPMVIRNTHEKHIYTKEELDEMGYVGAEDLGNGKYVYRYPVQIAINHFRALKKAYRKNGVKGCGAYIDRLKKLPDAD